MGWTPTNLRLFLLCMEQTRHSAAKANQACQACQAQANERCYSAQFAAKTDQASSQPYRTYHRTPTARHYGALYATDHHQVGSACLLFARLEAHGDRVE